jgi:hypothetical protein
MFTRKMIPFLLVAGLPIAGGTAPVHRLSTIELAVEMPAFSVRLDDAQRADLSARPCDRCAEVALHIDAGTLLSKAGRTLALDSLNESAPQGATLFYLPQSGRVTRIQLWH